MEVGTVGWLREKKEGGKRSPEMELYFVKIFELLCRKVIAKC